jgi:hypothetical protein
MDNYKGINTELTYKECTHKAIVVYGKPNLTGGKDKTLKDNARLLIALDSSALSHHCIDSYGKIGSSKQRIIYFPILDYSVPQNERILCEVLQAIDSTLRKGHKVHVHCIGGHGRTGLLLACYLGKYHSIKNPIDYVRKNYCEDAIESLAQETFILKFLGLPVPKRALVNACPLCHKALTSYDYKDDKNRSHKVDLCIECNYFK